MTTSIVWAVVATLAALAAIVWARAERLRRLDQGNVGHRLAQDAAAVFTADNPALLVAKLHTLRSALLWEADGRWPAMRADLCATTRRYQRNLVEMAWPAAPPEGQRDQPRALLSDWQRNSDRSLVTKWWVTGRRAAIVYETPGEEWLYRVSDPWREDTVLATDRVATETDARGAADAVLREHCARCAAFFAGASSVEPTP